MDSKTELRIMELERQLHGAMHPMLDIFMRRFAEKNGLSEGSAAILFGRCLISEGASVLCYGHSPDMDPEPLGDLMAKVVRDFFGCEELSTERN